MHVDIRGIKYNSLVFETPGLPLKYYVFPTVNDKYDLADVECQVIKQSVPTDGGPLDNHWRCRMCFVKKRKKNSRNMPLQGRYALGEWQTVNDYFVEEQFSTEEIAKYQLYYRYSHLLIMREFLADDEDNDGQQLAKATATALKPKERSFSSKIIEEVNKKMKQHENSGLSWPELDEDEVPKGITTIQRKKGTVFRPVIHVDKNKRIALGTWPSIAQATQAYQYGLAALESFVLNY